MEEPAADQNVASPAVFDAEEFFDETYLYFYEDRLNDTANNTEAEFVTRFFDLRPGMRVLDLPCGHGRISNRLAARGCIVSGLDSTELFLDKARLDATRCGVTVEYVQGDMRALPNRWSECFDRVLVWFSSLGYFDDTGNRQCLAEMHKVLRPGGSLLLDLHHRDWLVRHFQPDRVLEKNGDLLIDRSQLDMVNSRTIIERLIVRNGVTRRIAYFVRLFTPTELRDWLLDAGFTSVEVFGDDGGPLTLDSRRLLVLARR